MKLPEFLFHGTTYDFDTPRTGGYDDLFWTADSSAVAQNYISESNGLVSTGHIFSSDMNMRVRPNLNDPYYAIVQMMGHKAIDAKYDRNGIAQSFSAGSEYPTYHEMVQYIETHLGYISENTNPKSYRLKTKGWDSEARHDLIAPAAYKKPGFLHIVSGHEGLRIFDMSNAEGDLSSPQHNELSKFSELRKRGYDGVIINDFCQSKTWGNLEHKSYGFFKDSIAELKIDRIPAVNFDWACDNTEMVKAKDTAEFLSWKAAKLAVDSLFSTISKEKTYTLSELRRKASITQSR